MGDVEMHVLHTALFIYDKFKEKSAHKEVANLDSSTKESKSKIKIIFVLIHSATSTHYDKHRKTVRAT